MIYKRKQQQENKLAQETDTCFVYLFGGKQEFCSSQNKKEQLMENLFVLLLLEDQSFKNRF